ncbi:MAG: hypothetical protein R3C01_07520 [Planctomycetaceae bacterium]
MTAATSMSLSLGDLPEPMLGLGDAEFLAVLKWRRSAGSPLQTAARKGDVAAFEAAWREEAAGNSSPKQKKGPNLLEATTWLFPESSLSPSATAIRRVLAVAADEKQRLKAKEAAIAEGVSELVDRLEATASLSTTEALAGVTILQHLAATTPDGLLFRLWRVLLTAALHAAATPQSVEFDPADPLNVSASEMLLSRGEWPFRGAILFRPLSGAAEWGRRGRDELRRQLVEQLDSDGTPHASLLPEIGYWIGSIVRSTIAAGQSDTPIWSSSNVELLGDLSIHAAAFASAVPFPGRPRLEGGDVLPRPTKENILPPVTDSAVASTSSAASNGAAKKSSRSKRNGTLASTTVPENDLLAALDTPHVSAPYDVTLVNSVASELSTGDFVDGLAAFAALCRLTGSRGKTPQVRAVRDLIDWVNLSPSERQKKNDKYQSKRKKRQEPDSSVFPATQSDWGQVALLRSSWDGASDRCVVTYADAQPRLQLSASQQPLLQGTWGLSIEADGTPVDIPAEWESSCWFSDDDVDFLELRVQLEGDITILRQVVLVRREGLLFLCDIVNGGRQSRQFRVQSRLPLATGVTVEQDSLTREIQLVQDGLRGRVFSLAAPADRSRGADVEMVHEGGTLCITRQCQSGLAIPVMFLWTPGVLQQPADWTPLTVAENGKAVPPSEAVAGRLRVGSRQWLYYHCLNNGEVPRSVLGHHTSAETIFAKFPPDGTPQFLLVVKQDDEADGSTTNDPASTNDNLC